MRPRATYLLIAANLVVAGAIAWLHLGDVRAREQLSERRRLVAQRFLEPDTVLLSGPALDQPRRLERRDGRWWLTQPQAWPANPYAVSRMLHRLQRPESRSVFPLPESGAAAYGLEEDWLTVDLLAGDGRQQIRIGRPLASGGSVYVRAAGPGMVHAVPPEFVQAFASGLDDLRDSALFWIPVFEARSLSLQLPPPASLRVRVSRAESGWVFEAPIQARADTRMVEAALSRLNQARVLGFLEGAERSAALPGLASPLLRVTVEGNNRRQSLAVGPAPAGAPPETRAARFEDREAVFLIEASIVDLLLRAQEGLRERRLLPTDLAQVRTVEVAMPGRAPVSLQRTEAGRWQVVARGGQGSLQTYLADEETVGRTLERLSQLQALRFVNDAPGAADLENYQLTRPQREVRLTVAGRPDSVLLLGGFEAQTGFLYARLQEQPYVYAVDPGLLGDLPVAPLVYRDRAVLSLPAGARVSSISLFRETDGSEVARSEATAGGEVWGPLVSSLKAARFIYDTVSPPIGPDGRSVPWSHRMEVVLRLESGESVRTETLALLLADPGGDSPVVCGMPSAGVTFETTREFSDAVRAAIAGSQPVPR